MLKKRLFSLLLCISLLLGLVPMSAAAGDPVVFNPTAQGPVRYTVNGVTKTDTLEKAWNAVASSAGGTLTLRQDITDGTIALKPVFPVVSADPANPSEGEAWLKT